VRSLMHGLVEFAMWAGLLDISRNPMSLVQNHGATRRVRKARSLTAEQFNALLKELHEPFATMALVCVCLGLRISEALALRWADVDWLGSRLSVQRAIVEQVVDNPKTEGSAKTFDLAGELLERLKWWKQRSEFSGADDWIFASPVKLGRLPYSYTGVWRELVRAAEAAKIGHLGTHAFRHTYRSWLDAVVGMIRFRQGIKSYCSYPRCRYFIFTQPAGRTWTSSERKAVRRTLCHRKPLRSSRSSACSTARQPKQLTKRAARPDRGQVARPPRPLVRPRPRTDAHALVPRPDRATH
jgi:hypothetical protein